LSVEPATYANCPSCRLSIRVGALSVSPEHCPRCLARRREMVNLFVSSMPMRLLPSERSDATPAP